MLPKAGWKSSNSARRCLTIMPEQGWAISHSVHPLLMPLLGRISGPKILKTMGWGGVRNSNKRPFYGLQKRVPTQKPYFKVPAIFLCIFPLKRSELV